MTEFKELLGVGYNVSRPYINVFIKRKDGINSADPYEADWKRVDIINGINRIVEYGSVKNSIDASRTSDESNFEIDDITITFTNDDGFWNNANDFRSYFYGFISRNKTKIKIYSAYLDTSSNVVEDQIVSGNWQYGGNVVFEGLITKVVLSDNYTAKVTASSYLSVLNEYSVDDLSFTGSMSSSSIINTIMNQTKITAYIPYVAASLTINPYILDASKLTGTYWETIRKLAFAANSVPMLKNGTVWSVSSRTARAPQYSLSTNPDVVIDFYGQGNARPNIYKITAYDDEGGDRCVTRWETSDGALYVASSNDTLKLKYGEFTKQIDLANYVGNDKYSVLTTLLAYWQNPRPSIRFSCPFLVNLLSPLDKITITVYGKEILANETAYFDLASFDDGSVFNDFTGPINISKNTQFMVVSVEKSLDDWSTIIEAELIS